MSQRLIYRLYTQNEENLYYIFEIIPNTKSTPELKKFWSIFKNNPSIIENQTKIPQSIKDNFSLLLFFKFYYSLKLEQKNKAILYIENFINNELYDEFFVGTLLFAIKENLEVESYFEIEDQYYSNLLKSYYYIKHNEFDKAFNILADINSINRLSLLKEIFYLQCAIEKGLYDEAENIFSLLFEINKNNYPLKNLYIYYLLRKSEFAEAQKYFKKKGKNRLNQNEKTLYIYNLIESKQYDSAITFLKKESECDEDFFLLARLYHLIGLIDEAYKYYDLVDEIKFPANKMKGIILFQLGKIDDAINFFKLEMEKRYSDTDLIKIIRFLEMKNRWNNVKQSF